MIGSPACDRTGINELFWARKRVFVTGCTGFLGSWLVRYLVGAGAQTVGLIRDWTPESNLIQGGYHDQIVSVRGDLSDCALLERIIAEYEIEIVFHTAAQTIVSIASRSPLGTFESNIRGTWHLLEACRKSPLVKTVVVASSDKAYGSAKELPYSESTPLRGEHPYDVSKSCADLLAQSYFKTYRLPVVITRCGNLFGGGDLNFNRIIPGAIEFALAGRNPIIRSDGTFVRDYLYVEDACRAYLQIAQRFAEKDLAGRAYNISRGEPISVLDMALLALKACNREDLEPVILDEVKNEIHDQYLSADLIRTEIGWRSTFNVERGLERTVPWYRAYFEDMLRS